MDRTMITRTLSVEEVPASSTRVRLCTLLPDRPDPVWVGTDVDREEVLALVNELGQWLLEWDEGNPTHLLIVHPEAQLVSTRERKGQTILTLQWTPAEEED